MQRLLDLNYKNRFKITVAVLTLFVIMAVGIVAAVATQTPLDENWKEIVLVLVGAMIGWGGRVIDFWFNNSERDREIIARADHEDNETPTPPSKECDCGSSKLLLDNQI